MASYNIIWKRSALKELRALPKVSVQRIITTVEQLSNNPLPSGVRKIAGAQHTYRVREGDYRIIYTIIAAVLTIEIIRIGHRKDVYDH